MATIGHGNIPSLDIHTVVRWSFANSAARASTIVTTADIGKVGWELDSDKFYILKDTNPTWVLLNTASSSGNLPYGVTVSIESRPSANATILTFPIAYSISFPSGLTGSVAVCEIASTSTAVFTILKNGQAFGTCTFLSGQTTGTFAGTAGTVVAGDVMTIKTPATVDSTLANIGITLKGTA